MTPLHRAAALAAALALAAAPAVAGAQGPATIRGTVYACVDGAPIPHALVELRNLDDGSTIALTADAAGRFARVGLEPGRYLITASPDLRPFVRRRPLDEVWGPEHQPLRSSAYDASRLARLESDDVLDLRIGTRLPQGSVAGTSPHRREILAASTAAAATEPHPVCDAATVPPALATSDRTILH